MKLTAMTLLALMTCAGQTEVTEPEFANVFIRFDAGKLTALERQTPTIQDKAGGFIVMSMTSVSEFPGAKSRVRFATNMPMEFVVRSACMIPGIGQSLSAIVPAPLAQGFGV